MNVQYGFRKFKAQAQMLFPMLEHGNIKSKIQQKTEEGQQQR